MKGAYLSTIEERRYMERLLEENEGEKGDRSAVTRRHTTDERRSENPLSFRAEKTLTEEGLDALFRHRRLSKSDAA
jgi:hypothetical protein